MTASVAFDTTVTATGNNTGIVVPDEEVGLPDIARAEFHGEWNYTIRPFNSADRAVDS